MDDRGKGKFQKSERSLALKYGDKPADTQQAIEFLSTKVGLVLVVLGGMHFFNLFNFDKMRRKSQRRTLEPVPAIPVNQTIEALRDVHNR